MNAGTTFTPVIKLVDMSEEMQEEVKETTKAAFERCNTQKEMASFIKEEFKLRYGGTWHCIVGRYFGSYVTHESKHYIYFYIGQTAILLYKTG